MLNQITMIISEILLAGFAMTMKIVGVYYKGNSRLVASATAAPNSWGYLLFTI